MIQSLDKYLEDSVKARKNCARSSVHAGNYFCPKQNRYVADDEYCEEYT